MQENVETGKSRKSVTNAKKVPSLKDLMQDREIRAFFRFVDNHDLREKAVEVIENHLKVARQTLH